MIRTRVRNGRWERVAPGVYRIVGSADTPEQRALLPILAAGDDALLGGLSALALFGVAPAPAIPLVVRPPEAAGRLAGAQVRRSPVASVDRTSVGPIPCTTPARALLEVAATVAGAPLETLVDDVIDRRLSSPAGVLSVIRRAPLGHGRTGAPRLRAAMEPWLMGVRPGSPAEVRLIRRLADWGLPRPTLQHEVALQGGGRAFIDVAWLARKVGLEYDGSRAHTPRRLGHDVGREERLRAQGWWIGRVDRHDLAPSSTRLRDELSARLTTRAA